RPGNASVQRPAPVGRRSARGWLAGRQRARAAGTRSDVDSLAQRQRVGVAERTARLLQPTGPLTVHGVQIPTDARVLTLPLRPGSDPLAVRAVILHGGRAYGLPLGTTDSRRLAARVPAGARGGLLVSFTFDLTGTGLHGVANGGGNALTYAVGTMRIDAPRVDGRRLPFDVSAWTGTGGITPVAGCLHYFV